MSADSCEEEAAVRRDDDVRRGDALFGFVSCQGIADLAKPQSTFAVAVVNRDPEVLLVAEVNDGKGGVIGHVPRPRAIGRHRVAGFHWRKVTGFGVEAVLEESVVSFDVGDVKVAVVGWGQDAMSFFATFVSSGDPLCWSALFVEAVNVDCTAAIVGTEEETTRAVRAEIRGAVLEFEWLLVGHCARRIECNR